MNKGRAMNVETNPPVSTGPIETRTIDMVPEYERHGSASSQFTLWFGANLQITAVVDGALAIIFGVEAMTAIVGLLIGNILGGAVMALHSAQGPRLGLPQMISSRVQFGVKGAALPLVLVIIMYLGFAATGTATGAAFAASLRGRPAFLLAGAGSVTAVVSATGASGAAVAFPPSTTGVSTGTETVSAVVVTVLSFTSSVMTEATPAVRKKAGARGADHFAAMHK